jgi:hypothetical protein
MLEDTVKVRVAVATAPGWRSVLCWFHVMVMYPLALAGLQLLVVMFKDSERPLLVFLT